MSKKVRKNKYVKSTRHISANQNKKGKWFMFMLVVRKTSFNKLLNILDRERLSEKTIPYYRN